MMTSKRQDGFFGPSWRKEILLRARLLLLASLMLCSARDPAPYRDPPFVLPNKSELQKLRKAVIVTEKGAILIELYPEDAPWHVANLKYLADKGYYRGIPFHLYYENYIIQGGDRSGTGKGGPGYSLPAEFNRFKHVAGAVGMARISGEKNPERRSNGSQFHILMREASQMDGNYTIFGKVVRGMNTVRKLRKGDLIENLVVYVSP